MEKSKKHGAYWIMSKYEAMRKAGYSEKEIAEGLGFISVVEMRRWKSAFFAGSWVVYQRWAKYLEKEGKSRNEIALIIGKDESSVRLFLDEDVQRKLEEA